MLFRLERMCESQEISKAESAVRQEIRGAERVAAVAEGGREARGSDEEALTQFIDLRKTKKVRRTFADPSLSVAKVFRAQVSRQGMG